MSNTKITLGLADEQLSDADKKRIAKDLKKREQTPSFQHQSELYQFFQQQINELGNPYDVTRIPISTLKQMERDPMIAFGLHFSRTPIMTSRWMIQCERADIAAFIDRSLRNILPRYISQHTRCWNYGFAPIIKRFQLEQPDWTYIDKSKSEEEIKVWDRGNVEAITWKTFVSLPCDPAIVQPRWTEAGGYFNGITYNGQSLPVPFASFDANADDKKQINLRHSLWATNEIDSANGSIWGYPRVGYAYRYWWSYWFRWALYDRFFERKADPPYVVYYPTQGNDYAGDDAESSSSMKAIALSIGDSARGGGAIAMPADTISGYDDRPTSVREWEIRELEVKGDMSHFVDSFEYLDVMKLRALLVPEQAFLEGKGGTSSRNVASEEIDIHKEATELLSAEIDDHINRYIIPDLVTANFPEFKGEVKKVTTGFSDADTQALSEIARLIGQADVGALQNIDIREVFDRLGMPLVSHAEIKRQEDKIKADIAESSPDPIDPTTDAAGVSQEGLYIQPREVIKLADDSSFVTKLPKTRHYDDSEILTTARKMRNLWNDTYADAYENFAKFLSRASLDDILFVETLDLDAKLVPNKPGVKNWVERKGGLPKYIADIAGDLISEKGFSVSHAIATAVSQCKKWCAKGNAKACKAIAQWEKMKLSLNEETIFFADEDEAEKIADRILAQWKLSEDTINSLLSDSQDYLKRIISRAAQRELQRIRTEADWSVEQQDVAAFLEDRGAIYTTAITDTVRDELRPFLANLIREGKSNNEMANAVREHFADFPGWKADRLVRTEVRDAYNFATISAGEQAGIKIVQAIDAKLGNDRSDPDCIDRNGKFYKIGDALSEALAEHPNGTLEIRLTKRENLSVETVDNIEGDVGAYFDEDTDTIYLASDLGSENAFVFLDQMGRILENE